jgi:hypothetical protein
MHRNRGTLYQGWLTGWLISLLLLTGCGLSDLAPPSTTQLVETPPEIPDIPMMNETPIPTRSESLADEAWSGAIQEIRNDAYAHQSDENGEPLPPSETPPVPVKKRPKPTEPLSPLDPPPAPKAKAETVTPDLSEEMPAPEEPAEAPASEEKPLKKSASSAPKTTSPEESQAKLTIQKPPAEKPVEKAKKTADTENTPPPKTPPAEKNEKSLFDPLPSLEELRLEKLRVDGP